MRCLFLLGILAVAPALADEADDRLAVMRTILALNYLPARQSIFTPDASIDPEFDRLWTGLPARIQTRQRPGARPTITISHEPWGEATINWPAMEMEVISPRVVTDSVLFVTSDVALVDASSVYDGERGRERRRLVVVLRRAGDEWKIAVLRVLDGR